MLLLSSVLCTQSIAFGLCFNASAFQYLLRAMLWPRNPHVDGSAAAAAAAATNRQATEKMNTTKHIVAALKWQTQGIHTLKMLYTYVYYVPFCNFFLVHSVIVDHFSCMNESYMYVSFFYSWGTFVCLLMHSYFSKVSVYIFFVSCCHCKKTILQQTPEKCCWKNIIIYKEQ